MLRGLFLLCAALAATSGAAQSLEENWLRTRLRVSFTANEASAWNGRISLNEGRVERFQPLNTDPIIASGTQLRGGEVVLKHREPLARDVVDLTIHGPPDSEIFLRVGGAESRVSLSEIRQEGSQRTDLDNSFSVLWTRLPEDRLRVETDRDSLLFAPEETFEFDLLADPPGVALGEPYDVIATLSRDRNGPELWRSEATRHTAPVDGPARQTIRVPLPGDEGVYRVTLTVKRPPGFFSRFTRLPQKPAAPALAERTFQVAVFDDARPPAPPGAWQEAYSFDPRSHRWSDRLPRWIKWTAVPGVARAPRSSDGRNDLLAEQEGAIEIPPMVDSAAHWRAYPLPIDQPGSSYAVEVESLSSGNNGTTVAVLEPDALGVLRPVSGVVNLPRHRWNRSGERSPSRVLFRPRTASPLLVIANPDPDRPARFGAIRLFKSAGGERSSQHQRLVALDWADADLPRAVGASHPPRPGVGRAPDLQTWLETATRLADRVEASGANAGVVTVNRGGGTLYPSRVWPSPKYDLATWRDGSADLPRREGLKILAREFARRGLRLVPAIRFDAPTPAGDLNAPEIRARAVQEVLDQVGAAGSLFGFAIRVTPNGAELLDGSGAVPDAEKLLAGYRRIGATLRALPSPTPLILLPAGAAGSRGAIDALTPRLGSGLTAADETLASLGLEPLAKANHLLLVAHPHGAAPAVTATVPEQQAIRLEAIRRALPPSPVASLRMGHGELTLHEARERLGSPVRLRTVLADPAAEPSLLTRAARGGRRLVLIDGPAAAGLLNREAIARRRAFTSLPPFARREGSGKTEDVVAEAFDTDDDGSVVTLTNHSAWTRSVQLTVETPRRLAGAPLDAPDEVQWYDAGRHALSSTLPPHTVVAWRFRGEGVRALGVRVGPAPEARRELAERLADLQSRDTTRRRAVELISNASFEEVAPDGELTGWTIEGDARRSLADALEGDACAALKSGAGAPASLTSLPFAGPATGQLVVDLRVRLQDISPDARLRIELTDGEAETYLRDTELTGEQLAAAGADEWHRSIFPYDDLPISPDGQFQLRFTLEGDAQLLIDDLRTEDLVLPLDALGGGASAELRTERLALVRLMSTADSLLAEGRLEACRELLDGYWSRFLMEHFPDHQPEEPIESVVRGSTGTGTEPTPEDETPSLGERLRGYLPSWFR